MLTGGKGAGAPYSSARGQCRRGGSLEPPWRGASGAGGLLGQKVLREQLLRPPSARQLGDAPPPAFTGRPALGPAPHPRDLRRRAPAPPTAEDSASGTRASRGARALPVLALRLPRTRAPFTAPTPPPPAIRLNVAGARPAVPVTGMRGGAHEGSAQAQFQASASPLPPPLQGVPGRGEGLVARTPGSSGITNRRKAFTLIWVGEETAVHKQYFFGFSSSMRKVDE